jgi:hypothetical protein
LFQFPAYCFLPTSFNWAHLDSPPEAPPEAGLPQAEDQPLAENQAPQSYQDCALTSAIGANWCIYLTKSEPILNETDTPPRLGRGGIPPTPPFRRALAWTANFFGGQILLNRFNLITIYPIEKGWFLFIV